MTQKDQIREFVDDVAQRLGLPPEGRAAKGESSQNVLYLARRKGLLEAGIEYYVDERYEDDDLSTTGWALPAKMGLTRERLEFSAPSLEQLREELNS